MSHAAVEIDISESDGKAFKSKVRGKTFPVKHWIALLKKLNRNSDIVAERHFRNMLNNRMLKCGISVQCPQCTQHTWYSLDDLSDRVVCERCLEEFEFPVIKPISENKWHVRTIGPFSVENYAQGGYCVALTMNFFVGHHLTNEITWLPSFNISGIKTNPIEVDFGMFLSEGSIDEINPPAIIFGECKSYNEFEDEDINKLRLLAEKCPGAVIVFSTLRPSLKSREKKLIAKLARKGRGRYKPEQWINPVLILTGIELFSDFGPPSCWEEKGDPYSRFAKDYGNRNIQELCNITQQMHLGIESYWDWSDQKRKRRLANRDKKKNKKA